MPFTGIKPKYHKPSDLKLVSAIMNVPYPILGYSVPQQRALVKKLHAEMLHQKNDLEIWDFWQHQWTHGKSFEEKSLAVLFWSDQKNYMLAKKFYKRLLNWANDLTNWAHSDTLSSLYSKFLEDIGEPIDTVLKKWNQHQNPWLRRQSIVSLLYYTRLRKKTPTATRVLSAIKTLLDAPEYYVQKGVGWTLREVYQVDPKLTMTFIEKHLHNIQPAAYSAAVEKVSLAKKAALRQQRAVYRKSAAD